MWRTFVFISLTLLVVTRGAAQLPACSDRAAYISQPWIDPALACLEEVINDPSVGELGFTALAVAPDETLYAARPYTGEVLALTDTNGDLLPDTPQVVASGLTLPNGLAYHDGALYIVGGRHIYRLIGTELETLVEAVPAGGGFWTGGIAVSDRIYVSTGAPCDACEPDDSRRGAILSYALDGSDAQVVATGLRAPADVAFWYDELYTVDSARDDRFAIPDLDELNLVTPGANFGFPNCAGPQPDLDACADYAAPVLTFPTASTPIGLAAYTSDTLPLLTDSLLVVLNGSYNQLELRGYLLAAVRFDANGIRYEGIMPAQSSTDVERFTVDQMNYRGSGFFPQRPLDVAVSERGWVYISISGGRIIAMRPK